MSSQDVGKIVTVDGRIEPADLGVTSTHEHLFIDAVDAWYEPPSTPEERQIATDPISLDTLWYVRRNPMSHKDNLRLDSLEEAVDELRHFRQAGGDAIIDVTPKDVGADPERVREVAAKTGTKVVHGTAYYTQASHPDWSVEPGTGDLESKLEEEFVSDVVDGIGDTSVRAGIVGEIGLSDRIYPEEEAALRAGARAARRTGAALTVHPPGRTPNSQQDRTYPTSRWGLKVLDIVEEEGLPANRVIIDHLDRTLYESLDYQVALAERGAYLEYDVWGLEMYLDRYDDGYPNDSWRVDSVCELIERGYASQLLFGQDVYMKAQRRQYGGFGYAHLLKNIRPMLSARGIETEILDEIFIDNPRELLTFVEPEP